MRPKPHIVIGIIFVISLYFLFPKISLISLLIIFSSSVLIDFDHCIYYFIREKDLSLKRCYQWYDKELKKTLALPMNERKKRYIGFFIFHGLEPMIILFLLGVFVSPFFLFVAIGVLLHFVVDVPHEYYVKRTIQKISLIYNYTQWKKLEKFSN
jgi:hypothetical protein